MTIFNNVLPSLLGIQHVSIMFVSNFTPTIIIGLIAGYTLGSEDLTYMIQMAMLFSGLSTLIQTIGIGYIGARLPIVQGTSFAFVPAMALVVKSLGISALFGAIFIGSIVHIILGFYIAKIRYLFPPLITGMIVLTIGLSLIEVGVVYAAGGMSLINEPEFGSIKHWGLSISVILSTLIIKINKNRTLSSFSTPTRV